MTFTSVFEQAFGIIFRLPELWLTTWWQILRRPWIAPIRLALSTRKSTTSVLPSNAFFVGNSVLGLLILRSGLITRSDPDLIDWTKFSRLEDYSALELLVFSILCTSIGFSIKILCSLLSIDRTKTTIFAPALVYYLSLQIIPIYAMFAVVVWTSSEADFYFEAARVVALLALALIWLPGATWLSKASKLRLVGKLPFYVVVSVVLLFLLIIGLSSMMIASKFGDYALSGTLKNTETVDIVKAHCDLSDNELVVTAFVYNGTNSLFTIDGVHVEITEELNNDTKRIVGYDLDDGFPKIIRKDSVRNIQIRKSWEFRKEVRAAINRFGGYATCKISLILSRPEGATSQEEWIIDGPDIPN